MNIAILIGVFVFAIIIGNLPYKKILEHLFRNRADIAIVYFKTGSEVKSYPARLVQSMGAGQMYLYNYQGKEWIVVVPEDYQYQYIHGKRMLGVDNFKVVGASMIGVGGGGGTQTVSALLKGKTIVEAINSLRAKKPNIGMVILIVAGLLLVGVYLYMKMRPAPAPELESMIMGIIEWL